MKLLLQLTLILRKLFRVLLWKIMDRLVHQTLKETVPVQHTVLEAVEVLIYSCSVEVLITTMITHRQMKMKTVFKHQGDGVTLNQHQPPIQHLGKPSLYRKAGHGLLQKPEPLLPPDQFNFPAPEARTLHLAEGQ